MPALDYIPTLFSDIKDCYLYTTRLMLLIDSGDTETRQLALDNLTQVAKQDTNVRSIAASGLGFTSYSEVKPLLVEIMKTSQFSYDRIEAALSFLRIQSGKYL
mgnify:CR=1 FL=1